MAVTVELACTKSAMVWEKNPNQNYSGQSTYDLFTTSGDGEKRLYLAFGTLSSSLRNYAITKAQVKISVNGSPEYFYIYDISTDFDVSTLTWANKPSGRALPSGTGRESSGVWLLPRENETSKESASRVKRPFVYLRIVPGLFDSYDIVDVSSAKLVVTYDTNITVTSYLDVQTSGSSYRNPRIINRIKWSLKTSGGGVYDSYNSVDGFSQASASLFWRSGTSGAFTEIAASGSQMYVDVPANTFPVAETIQYYVVCTDSGGTTNTSSTFSFTTTDSAISTAATAPINTIEDGGGPITLRWTVSSPNGTTPTRIDIAWKLSTDANWTHIDNLDGTLTAYTVAGGTFGAGEILWAVRAYNADGTAGSWSATVRFVCVAAPNAPSVSTDAAPFATFDWQAGGQQAWRLTVDGKLYGPFFGSAKSFTLPDYLADGEHVAGVEVQGQYGLWSQPGTIAFTVANTPGDDVTLQGEFGVDAAMLWETDSSAADFLIYRDDVQIGHTAGLGFTDRFTLGEHAWQVINRLADGNYTASNTVTGICKSCVTRVAPLAGGEWLELPLSERSNAEQKFQYSRKYSLRHVMGAELPVLELSPYEDGAGSYEAAFRTVPEAKAFEALRGKVVIIKSRGGQLLVGALTDVTTRMTNFYIAAEFSVQRCHWEDYVDVQND